MSEIWQDTCVGILLCCAVSLSPVLDRSVSPEGLFQASREASQFNGEAWQKLLNPVVLDNLSGQSSGAAGNHAVRAGGSTQRIPQS
ncbi:hypothetical protein KDD30_09630 [Photobacterium sp. GJ3]|uniref:hypothetical protein n=1 Tax=Photobacterium sp. GJ3 TaxID=2829502 RepID=UPI001B8AB5AD|nr:hypothetical protein [Photobacterium sp. GJ3]QUJ66432.1 hypothetical protein KDD30_09630 [Photobacterium sp. GJ3]